MRRPTIRQTIGIIATPTWLFWSVALVQAQHPAVGIVGIGSSRGTATLISHHATQDLSLVISAGHVFRGESSRPWIHLAGKRYYGDNIAVDRSGRLDVAAFVVRSDATLRKVNPMAVWPGELAAGSSVWAEGYSGNRGFGRMKGEAKRSISNGEAIYDFPSIPGDSGGPIYVVDKNHVPYLVGITSGSNWGDPGGPTFTVGAGPTAIRDWLGSIGWSVGGQREMVKVSETGCVIFGRRIFRRPTLQGRAHPAPFQIDAGSLGGSPACQGPSCTIQPPRVVREQPSFVQPPARPPQQPPANNVDIEEIKRELAEQLAAGLARQQRLDATISGQVDINHNHKISHQSPAPSQSQIRAIVEQVIASKGSRVYTVDPETREPIKDLGTFFLGEDFGIPYSLGKPTIIGETSQPTGNREWHVYVSTKSIEYDALNRKVQQLKSQGAPIRILWAKTDFSRVVDIPRIFVPSTGRDVRGVENVDNYLDVWQRSQSSGPITQRDPVAQRDQRPGAKQHDSATGRY